MLIYSLQYRCKAKMKKQGLLIVNFGGPRSLEEVRPFLKELLCDKDVVRSYLPAWAHNILFKTIANFRAAKIAQEYTHIGSKSPIWEDTQWLAHQIQLRFQGPVWTFHRYLSATHRGFLENVQLMHGLDQILVMPLFPQFSYATTGSIARWMQQNLPKRVLSKLVWIRSYCQHPNFIGAYAKQLETFIQSKGLEHEELAALVSFHGVPLSFIEKGDCYYSECKQSFEALQTLFPKVQFHMSFQSKFGPGEWLRPYTEDACNNPKSWTARSKVVVIPLAFTSDHIETLCEIENQYLPPLRLAGLQAWRLDALNREPVWVDGFYQIIQEGLKQPWHLVPNQMLIASYCLVPKVCSRLGLCSCVKL